VRTTTSSIFRGLQPAQDARSTDRTQCPRLRLAPGRLPAHQRGTTWALQSSVQRRTSAPRTAARTPMSSPFRGRWPRSGRRGPASQNPRENKDILPLQGPPTRTRCPLHRPNTVSSVEIGSGLTARTSAGAGSYGATTAAPPVRFAPGALLPQTPPGFRGELRPPRAPPAGGLLASLRTSPWTPCAGPVPMDNGSQGSKAGAWSRAGCRVWASMGSGDDESKSRCQIRRFVR